MLYFLTGPWRRLSNFLFHFWQFPDRWQDGSTKIEGRKHFFYGQRNTPIVFPVQWSSTTKLFSVVRLLRGFTHILGQTHIWAKSNQSLWRETTEHEASDRNVESLKKSSQHSPGVKKTLRYVAQSPYTQSLAAFEEQPECSQATSPAPFMICNGIVEERQQHPHHRTKPI